MAAIGAARSWWREPQKRWQSIPPASARAKMKALVVNKALSPHARGWPKADAPPKAESEGEAGTDPQDLQGTRHGVQHGAESVRCPRPSKNNGSKNRLLSQGARANLYSPNQEAPTMDDTPPRQRSEAS